MKCFGRTRGRRNRPTKEDIPEGTKTTQEGRRSHGGETLGKTRNRKKDGRKNKFQSSKRHDIKKRRS